MLQAYAQAFTGVGQLKIRRDRFTQFLCLDIHSAIQGFELRCRYRRGCFRPIE
jgi:hypothetical protein